ncbi:hypothetical protein [Bacillus sp. OTU2372]|uniref:hypothetical protein n=1 Tax=Bacillus sp. OTU2372 TaxID=3043858 RepID=UPI00313D1A2B
MNNLVLSKSRYEIRPKRLIYFILILTLLMGTLVDDFHFPSSISYLNDICVVALFYFILPRFVLTFKNLKLTGILIVIGLFILSIIIGIIINLVPINLVVWAIRNTFRFFTFFIACVCYLNKNDLDYLFRLFYKLQWLNLVLAFYQYFVLGLSQDFLGGIFGHGGGAGLTVFSCLLLAYATCSYLSKKLPLYKLIFIMLSTMIINAMAEQKIFYFEFVIILILALLFCNATWKKFKIFIVGIGGIFIGLTILKNLFPLHFEILTNFAMIEDYANMTSGGYEISRWGAFSQINSIFFKNDIILNLFGYGFGNAEYSAFPYFTSSFYVQYGQWHYRWFTHQWTFLETGYVGFILYVSFFVAIFVYASYIRKWIVKKEQYYIVITQIMVVVCIVSIWYNALLKMDFGYIAFFALTLSGILMKDAIFMKRKGVELIND